MTLNTTRVMCFIHILYGYMYSMIQVQLAPNSIFFVDIEDDFEDFGTYEDNGPSGISASCGVPSGEEKVINQKNSSGTSMSEINGVNESELESTSAQLRVAKQRVQQLEEELGRVLGDFERVRSVFNCAVVGLKCK